MLAETHIESQSEGEAHGEEQVSTGITYCAKPQHI